MWACGHVGNENAKGRANGCTETKMAVLSGRPAGQGMGELEAVGQYCPVDAISSHNQN